MIWAITGANGQLGRSLAELLEIQGKSFIALNHKDLDVSSDQAPEKLVSLKPGVIVNCAAWTNVDLAESQFEDARKVNEHGATNVALAAKKLEIPLVHVSTDYVFSGKRENPWRTNEETEPTSKYGLSKLLGEKSIMELYGEESSVLRTAWLYGPYGKNFAKTMVRKALLSKETIKVVGDQIGQPTSTKDLALQIIKVVESETKGQILHATNSGSSSWYDFASEIFALCGEPKERVVAITSSEFPTPVKRPVYSVLDHSDWLNHKLIPMRPWRDALVDIFPSIKLEVERETLNG